MKRTRHGDNLIQATRFPLLFPVNCYFVRESDGLTLIDTGISGTGRRLISAARELGQPIVRVLLTHAHVDHAGSLDELRELLPDAEFLFGERTASFLAGDLSRMPGDPDAKLRGNYVTARTEPTRTLAAGDRVGSLDVIAAPGHAPDQLAFLDSRDGTLIAGDAYQARGGLAVSGNLRFRFPFPALATWHKPTALMTARSLRSLDPSRLAVGHGDVIENPISAMERAIQDAAAAFGSAAPDVA